MAEAALSMWLRVEWFLRSRGFTEEAVACIVETACAQGLDATKINRVLDDEQEEAATLH
jgi:hypothetical protein